MKIRELHIEGFRSLKSVTWQPGDLNILIGPNGTGKSNLLRVLECISVSAKGRLSDHIKSLGGIGPLLWDGEATEIRWRIDCEAVHSSAHAPLYDAVMSQLGKGSSYRVEREELWDGACEPPALVCSRHGTEFRVTADGGSDFAMPGPIPDDFESESYLLGMMVPSQPGEVFNDLRRFFPKWTIYHDMRVDQDAELRRAAVARYEKRVDPDGQNLISVLHTLYNEDRDFKSEINAAMVAAFGDDFEELVFPPAADQRVQMRIRWKSLEREQSAADLSDGTLRFLLLLTILATPEPPPLIAIDEPETGLHPSMLPIIAEFAEEASRRSQVIITTHSAELLNAFTDARPTTTVALWEAGETLLKVIDGGTLEKWLRGYSLGKLYTSGELESLA